MLEGKGYEDVLTKVSCANLVYDVLLCVPFTGKKMDILQLFRFFSPSLLEYFFCLRHLTGS